MDKFIDCHGFYWMWCLPIASLDHLIFVYSLYQGPEMLNDVVKMSRQLYASLNKYGKFLHDRPLLFNCGRPEFHKIIGDLQRLFVIETATSTAMLRDLRLIFTDGTSEYGFINI